MHELPDNLAQFMTTQCYFFDCFTEEKYTSSRNYTKDKGGKDFATMFMCGTYVEKDMDVWKK